MEDLLEQIKTGLETGELTKEEASELVRGIQAAMEIETESMDMEAKGRILTTISVISKLL